MRIVDRLLSTEAADAGHEAPKRSYVRGRAALSDGAAGPMQPPIHFPARRELIALRSESEREILRAMAQADRAAPSTPGRAARQTHSAASKAPAA